MNSATDTHPLFVALDVDSPAECLRLARALKGKVGALKIGPRLLMRKSAELISEVAECAPVFVDNKYLDIPSTMEAAVRATFDAGATYATVHAWAGQEALERLAKLEYALSQKRPFRLLAVTILTSFTQQTLPPPLEKFPIDKQVLTLARLARASGIRGIVCSPHESAELRAMIPDAFIVTPGVRPIGAGAGDQKRAMTPREALENGADALVVGRPIVEASDPIAAAEAIITEMCAAKR